MDFMESRTPSGCPRRDELERLTNLIEGAAVGDRNSD